MQFVTVFVGGEEVGLPIGCVREIVEHRPVTRVPSMPSAIRGVTNLRGRVVPVVDLAGALRLGARTADRWSCFAVVEVSFDGDKLLLALHADAIGRVLELGDGEVLPPPTFGTRVRLDYLVGMAAVDDRFALLLDIGRVLSPAELLAASSLREEAGRE
ncbi:MAG TPA: chemotaxis protein CheW [Polyangia bacterium]|nr:chemotaxis protein CheW [Polyangia bacterium]